MTRSISCEHSAQSVKQRAVSASAHRKREVHSVRIVSCSEMKSVEDGANLTSFFLLETPFPSYKGKTACCFIHSENVNTYSRNVDNDHILRAYFAQKAPGATIAAKTLR